MRRNPGRCHLVEGIVQDDFAIEKRAPWVRQAPCCLLSPLHTYGTACPSALRKKNGTLPPSKTKLTRNAGIPAGIFTNW